MFLHLQILLVLGCLLLVFRVSWYFFDGICNFVNPIAFDQFPIGIGCYNFFGGQQEYMFGESVF
jgi:hypothetical protein